MLGALIPIGAAIVGGLIGKESQENTNETNVALGREQMAFQERMSNTAYQRARKDMEAAGFNPMLAYSQGGASAPMGSMPQVQNAMSAGMSSAAQSMQVMQGVTQMMQTAAGTEKLQAEAEKIRSETMEKEANTAKQAAEIKELQERGARVGFEKLSEEERVRLLRWELKERQRTFSAREEHDTFADEAMIKKLEKQFREMDVPRARAEQEFYERLGQGQPWMRFLLEILKGAKGAAR